MQRAAMKRLFRIYTDDGQSNVITDQVMEDLLFEGAKFVFDILDEQDNPSIISENTFEKTTGSSVIDLPSNVRRVTGMYRPVSSERRIHFTFVGRNEFLTDARDYLALLKAKTIEYTPINEAHRITLEYVLELSNITDDNNTWTELSETAQSAAVLQAAILALAGEDSRINKLQEQLDRFLTRLQNVSQQKQTATPRSVRYIAE